MRELPDGWAATQLGELVSSIVGGGTPSKSNAEYFQGAVPFMTVKDMHARFIVDTQDHITEDALVDSASRLIPADTLVVASRMSLGKIARPVVSVAINQDLKALFLREGIDKTYVEYAWRAKESEIQGMGTGTTVKGIRLEDIRGLDIALAPSSEQTRIANQLDTLLTRVQACNDRFDAIPALLKRFRNSVLAAAVSGRLTGDLRSEDSITSNSTTSSLWRIPASWRWLRADEVTGFITKGTTPSKEKMTSGSGEIPYIKVYNLGFDGRLDFSVDPTFVESITHSVDLKRSITLPGDVLMNIVGPPLGKVAIVPDSHQEWNINQAIARFRPVQGLLSPYLAHCLMSTELISYAVSQAKATVGQLNLTLEICRALPIPMPPEKEQTEIVRRVEALFALADRIEARCTAARTQAQRLSPLVLAKAFRGELVPQDPNDEPASALLARIASSNTAVAGKNKREVPVAHKERAQAAINL